MSVANYLDLFYRLASLLLVWLVLRKLDRVLQLLGIVRREAKIMANTSQEELEILIQAINEESSEIDGAIVLIDSIPSLIASAGTDPVKIAELVHLVQAKSAALKAAIVANTPSAPASPAADVPPATPSAPASPAADVPPATPPADSGAAAGPDAGSGEPPAS